MNMTFRKKTAGQILFFCFLWAAVFWLPGCRRALSPKVVIGSKMDTEGAILGYIQLLALRQAGIPVEDRIETGPTLIVRQALLSGEIDGYLEYTGTALVNFMGVRDRKILTNPDSGYAMIKKWDLRENGIQWLRTWSGINNTYTVLLNNSYAKSVGITTISDLHNLLKRGSPFRFAVDPEFAARRDGLPGLLKFYKLNNLQNLTVVQMDAGLVYQSLKQGSVDGIIGYSTDGRIAAFHFTRLRDDRNYFPVYTPTPVFRRKIIDRFPRIQIILDKIAGQISAEDITRMNYQHDVHHKRAKVLAGDWLCDHNFLE